MSSLNGHELEPTLGDSEAQGGLACCSPWGRRVGHDLTIEQQIKGRAHGITRGCCDAAGAQRPRAWYQALAQSRLQVRSGGLFRYPAVYAKQCQ